MSVVIENRANLTHDAFANWENLLCSHTSVRHALDHFLSLSPQVVPTDAVPQDEYSHDILFPVAPDLWIVYDCT